MAIKDRISGIFRRKKASPTLGGEDEQTPESTETRPARKEDRQELLRQLGDGIGHIGGLLERLDRHMETGNRHLNSLVDHQDRLPTVLDEQRELIARTTEVATTQQAALDAFIKHLAERDQVQEQLVERLDQIGDGLKHLRDQDRSQADLFLQMQRSGRRLVLILAFLGMLLFTGVLLLLLVLALKPEWIEGAGQAVPASAASEAPTTEGSTATRSSLIEPPRTLAPDPGDEPISTLLP